jgi:hypothetical protein
VNDYLLSYHAQQGVSIHFHRAWSGYQTPCRILELLARFFSIAAGKA